MDVNWRMILKWAILFLPGALLQLTDLKVNPKSVVQIPRAPVLIDCVPVGSDKAKISWTFNNEKQVTNSSKGRIYVYSNNSLFIPALRKKQAGQYTCKAVEEKIKKSRTVPVSIAFLDPLGTIEDKNALADSKVNITCPKPSGNPEPSISWKMDGNKDLPSDQRYKKSGWSLIISNAKGSDSHNFTCIVKNIVKTLSTTMTLTVTVPGNVKVTPESLTRKEGETAWFHCQSLAKPPMKLQWQRKSEGNKPSPELNSDKLKPFPNGSLALVISPVMSGDRGQYICRSTFPDGGDNVYKKTVTLTVLEKIKINPKHDSKQSLDYSRRKDRLKVTCYFEGYGTPTITWSKEGLSKLPSRMKANGSVLYIKDLEYEDAGIYHCKAKGPFNDASGKVNVTIYAHPVFTHPPMNTTIQEGDSAFIDCKGTGWPTPTVNWGREKNNGNKLPPNFKQLPNGSLHISEVKLEDAGEYYCILGLPKTVRLSLNTTKFFIIVKERFIEKPEKGKQQSMGRTVGIAVGCAGAYIVLVIGLMIYCRSRRSRLLQRQGVVTEVEDGDFNKDPLMANQDYPMDDGNIRSVDRWQFPREDLEELQTLGHGKMGRIFVAKATGIREGPKDILVAVKEFDKKDEYRKEEFDGEFDALAQLQHDNVIKLLGVCTTEYPLYLITEYSEQGDLKQFLGSAFENRNGPVTLTGTQRANICLQIASGMEYLSCNRVIHRDLAARNCVVMPNLDIKVAFLSICEDTYAMDYYMLNGASVPLRWLSPEAVEDEDYSDKSDVWAFAVTAWEVYSPGQQPYSEMQDEEVLKGIRKDLRLPRPSGCSMEVYKILETCWAADPEARPKFDELVSAFASVQVDSNV